MAPGALDPVVEHAASHGGRLNARIHLPAVAQVIRMVRQHGYAAVPGDIDGVGHEHSADVTVVDWFARGVHLRIDVKSGVEFGQTNQHTADWSKACEARTRRQHGRSPVLPFVVGVAGGLGRAAARFIKQLGKCPGATLPAGDELTWTVPSHSKYWHRVFRSLAWHGFWACVADVLGKDVGACVVSRSATGADIHAQAGALCVPAGACQACGEPPASCACQCSHCEEAGVVPWPACRACSSCAVHCECGERAPPCC